jgi:hypothetical protein
VVGRPNRMHLALHGHLPHPGRGAGRREALQGVAAPAVAWPKRTRVSKRRRPVDEGFDSSTSCPVKRSVPSPPRSGMGRARPARHGHHRRTLRRRVRSSAPGGTGAPRRLPGPGPGRGPPPAPLGGADLSRFPRLQGWRREQRNARLSPRCCRESLEGAWLLPPVLPRLRPSPAGPPGLRPRRRLFRIGRPPPSGGPTEHETEWGAGCPLALSRTLSLVP